MDHHDVSNDDDTASAFRVAETAGSNILSHDLALVCAQNIQKISSLLFQLMHFTTL